MKQNTRSHIHKSIARNSPYILLLTFILFLASALLLGEILHMYDVVWWWDDMLHGISGVIFGLVGLLAIYFFNARYSMAISPAFVAVFVLCFATTMGVLWEVYEFVVDVTFKATMQQWNMPPHAVVMGKDYQGMGLRDTMSDLIIATVGSGLAAVFSYVAYRHEKLTVLGVMRRSLPWIRRRSAKQR